MSEQLDDESRPRTAAPKPPRPFRSLLVPLDFSPASDRVAGRVALLPLATGARLTLMHVVPRNLPTSARERAKAEALKTLTAQARRLTAKLPSGVDVAPLVMVGAAAAEIAKRADKAKVDLVVMGRGGGRALRDVFLGSTAERVIRRGQLPVLVVRLPQRAAYRRPSLALDVDQTAPDVLDLLLRVLPVPRPAVEVIHAYDAPHQWMRYGSLSNEDAEEYRAHYRQKALHEIAALLAASLARTKLDPRDAPLWRTQLRYGSPRSVIAKAVEKRGTDLLVLGTHAYSGVAQAFLGTVAGDVLREVACDVLVVPPRGTLLPR